MSTPSTLRWVGLALLGILVAVGVAIAASSLASREIGLASEPIDAGQALAPRASGGGAEGEPKDIPRPARDRRPKSSPRSSPSPLTAPPTPKPAAPEETGEVPDGDD